MIETWENNVILIITYMSTKDYFIPSGKHLCISLASIIPIYQMWVK